MHDLIEIGDAYVGRERNGGKAGRGSENKVPIVAAVSETMEGGPLRAIIAPLSGFTKAAVAEWAQRHLNPDCEVYTDGLSCFGVLSEMGDAHTVIQAGSGSCRDACRADGARWVNVFLSNVKRAIDGRYHAFAFRKYAKRYLAEDTWRINWRLGLADIASDLIESLTSMAPCPDRELRPRVAA